MREIKFRLYDNDNNVMDYVDLRSIDNAIASLDQYRDYFSSNYFSDGNMMQYTGLKDKNGVEIYEGDILLEEEELGRSQRKLRRHSIVVFENNGWKRDSYNGSLNVFPQINCRSMEVIGNIYENPELLEQK